MLAYVFWHWPRRGADPKEYEARLGAFHGALAAAPPAGFLRSAAFGVEGAEWVEGAPAYEDWYLLDDTAALDRLEEAAVTASRREPHDRVAAWAAGGSAGLYRALRGAGAPGGETSLWLAKPAGLSYVAFLAELERRFPPPLALWQRRLVLGPAPEFCVAGAAAALAEARHERPPAEEGRVSVRRRRIWPAGA